MCWILGTRLFVRSLQEKPAGDVQPLIGETEQRNSYEVYEPKDGAWKTIVMVYGMGLPGERDPRLNKFAQACLEAGTRVIVPNLSGVKNYRLEESDLVRLIDVLNHIAMLRDTGFVFKGPITIVAFSAGASISLSACASAFLNAEIHSLLLFSPLYDIREVWKTLHESSVDHRNPKNLDNSLWTQFVIAYRNRTLLGFNETDNKSLEDILRYYDSWISLKEKLSFYNHVVAPLKLNQRDDLLMEENAFDVLSPKDKLKFVKARVAIIHDATDTVVPPSHGERIVKELKTRENREGAKDAKIVITPLLAHVTVTGGVNVFEVFKLIDMLGEVFV
jgi:pimeloyl-ACP methyl ester carboxylesterase